MGEVVYIAKVFPLHPDERDDEQLARHICDLHNRSIESCAWTEDSDGIWSSSCEQDAEFLSGGPMENSYRYCPYCGKPLEQKLYVEPQVEA